MKVELLARRHLKPLGIGPEYLGDFAFAALRDGVPIAASGVAEQWEGRGYAWFVAAEMTKREWAEVTGLVKDGLSRVAGYRRIEMVVRDNCPEAHRWAVCLGFEPEALLRKYLPNGEDGWLYVIMRD